MRPDLHRVQRSQNRLHKSMTLKIYSVPKGKASLRTKILNRFFSLLIQLNSSLFFLNFLPSFFPLGVFGLGIQTVCLTYVLCDLGKLPNLSEL